MNNLLNLFLQFHLSLFVKGAILLFLFLYLIFAVIIFNQVRSLERIVSINEGQTSRILFMLALLYLVASASLFFLAIGIL